MGVNHVKLLALDELLGEPMSFASLLRTIRETDEYTQAGLAKKLGVSKAHICDLEKQRKFVSAERAARFANKLGYSEALFVRVALQDQVNEAGLDYQVHVGAA